MTPPNESPATPAPAWAVAAPQLHAEIVRWLSTYKAGEVSLDHAANMLCVVVSAPTVPPAAGVGELVEGLEELLEHLKADWGHDHHFKLLGGCITALKPAAPAVQEQPPCDDAHVAPGCQLFSNPKKTAPIPKGWVYIHSGKEKTGHWEPPAVAGNGEDARLVWKPIEQFDYKKMQFVLVAEDGAVRLRLWTPSQRRWELDDGSECCNPTHFG